MTKPQIENIKVEEMPKIKDTQAIEGINKIKNWSFIAESLLDN